MGEELCKDGQLDAASYTSPIPLIGLYIAIATLVCFCFMTCELLYGFFIRRKPFLPCKVFPMNAFSLTLLAVATKIPNDLITQMPRAEDQLSKLTGTALLCTSLGYFMPSLGTMDASERYQNLGALTLMVITMVVNVCVQMHTGVIFAFKIEHIIIMVCIVLLLLVMWTSPIALREQMEYMRSVDTGILPGARHQVKNFEGLWGRIKSAYGLSYQYNGQILLCNSPNHHTFGLLCVLSLVVVSQSTLRYWIAPKSLKSCGITASDYKWSIPIVIVTQFLTIVLGSIPTIYRWFSLLRHFNKISLEVLSPQLDLENLKSKASSFRFLNKKLTNFLLFIEDCCIDFLMSIQMILYKCNILFVGFPIYFVKILLDLIIHCTKSIEEEPTGEWIHVMLSKEMDSYRTLCTRDRPSNLLDSMSTHRDRNPGSNYAHFNQEVQKTVKEWNKETSSGSEYRVSCLSVLVLSGILAELVPLGIRRETVMQILKESFDVIYYVDQKTNMDNTDNKKIWMSAKEVWRHWEDPSHWFRTKIISRTYKGFNLKQVDDVGILMNILDVIEIFFDQNEHSIRDLANGNSLNAWHTALVSNEFAIICKFIRHQMYLADDVIGFLEMLFINMVCFSLSRFPLAVLKDMDEDDPYEIGEERARNAFKYFCQVEPLRDIMEWSFKPEFEYPDDPSAAADIEDGSVWETRSV